MSKVLVTYFSASGVTAKTANKLAKEVDGDVFEIEPKEKYTSADLNWMDKKSRSSVEMNDPASRPEIAKQVENMDMYDTVLVGFPIWWYVEPKIIDTFLDSYDFSGKTVIPFCYIRWKWNRKCRKELTKNTLILIGEKERKVIKRKR